MIDQFQIKSTLKFAERFLKQSLLLAMVLTVSGLGLNSCRTIRPYEKEYLLHPTMDDSRVESLSGPYGKTRRPSERLAASGGGGGSSACPTCGGK
jgi:hypothetical protein